MPHRRGDLHGHAIEQVQSNRDIVWGEVPDYGNIPAHRAEVGADALDITDSAQSTLVEDLADIVDPGVEAENVADHEDLIRRQRVAR